MGCGSRKADDRADDGHALSVPWTVARAPTTRSAPPTFALPTSGGTYSPARTPGRQPEGGLTERKPFRLEWPPEHAPAPGGGRHRRHVAQDDATSKTREHVREVVLRIHTDEVAGRDDRVRDGRASRPRVPGRNAVTTPVRA